MKYVKYWDRNLKYYIKKAFFDNGASSLDCLDDLIIKQFKERYITPKDEQLLNIVLREESTQEDVDNFLSNWDIEEEGGHKGIMFSYFIKMHPDFKYPEYVEPRLRGLLQYYRFRNLKLISHFKRICTRLKAANIDILILKGGAMRHFRPEYPRFMADIDILVRNMEDYELAKSIVKEMGYTYKEWNHSFDVHEGTSDDGILDIHHNIDMRLKKGILINDILFERANIEKIFNVEDVYIPKYEDMLFLLLINLSKNLITITSYANVLHSIIDCSYLMAVKPDLDWDIVRQYAIKTKTEDQIYIVSKFLNEFLPVKIPEMFKEEFFDRSILYLYNKWFIKKMRKKSHSQKIKNIIKTMWKDLSFYFKFRPQYILYRRKTIAKSPGLAKMVLKKQRLVK